MLPFTFNEIKKDMYWENTQREPYFNHFPQMNMPHQMNMPSLMKMLPQVNMPQVNILPQVSILPQVNMPPQVNMSPQVNMPPEMNNNNKCQINYKRKKKVRLASKIEKPKKVVDITPYLTLPQSDVAPMLGLTLSTFNKRFKSGTDRRWPYRKIKSIEKIIESLPKDDPYVKELLIKKNELLRPAFITI